MKIAVEGCCHGSLDATYNTIAQLERKNNYNIDLLLIAGDFQAIRNQADLMCMAVPQKYKHLGEFHKYYTGQSRAPILTIVIGGNHEASNYLWELYHGGWLAPNIYYLGAAGCVNVNGVRIAGISGIYNSAHYRMGHFERVPYESGSMRSIYHIRQYDILKLSQLSPPDIFMSHDWPQGIEHHGDLNKLLKLKPFFRSDIEKGELGSPPLTKLIKTLRPDRWFAAHLHVRFEASFEHGNGDGAQGSGAVAVVEANPDEIVMDDFDEFDDPAPAPAPPIPVPQDKLEPTRKGADKTLFLALDKCLPRRQFLEVVDIPTPFDHEKSYDTAPSEATPAASSSAIIPNLPTALESEPSQPNPPPEPSVPASTSADASSTSDTEVEALVEPPSTAEAEAEEVDPEAEALLAFSLPTSFAFGSKHKHSHNPPTPSLPKLPKNLPPKPTAAPSAQSQASSLSGDRKRMTPKLTYDPEWLTISRAYHPFLSLSRTEIPPPSESEMEARIAKEREWVNENVGEEGKEVENVQKFVMTAPGPVPGGERGRMPLMWFTNPQTEAFCTMIGVENKINPAPKA